MCNTQTKGVELQGNANAVANVKNVVVKPEILKLQEFISDWYGENTKQASNHLRSIFFEFVNQSLKNDACLLATYENELFLLQNLIEILDVETQTFVFNENDQQRTIEKQQNEITGLKKTISYKEELIQAQEQEIKSSVQLIEIQKERIQFLNDKLNKKHEEITDLEDTIFLYDAEMKERIKEQTESNKKELKKALKNK